MSYTTQRLRHVRRIIGHNIHHHRCRKKLPLSKLAALSGIPERMLDHYELGKSQIELLDMLKIACALGVPVADFMEDNAS